MAPCLAILNIKMKPGFLKDAIPFHAKECQKQTNYYFISECDSERSFSSGFKLTLRSKLNKNKRQDGEKHAQYLIKKDDSAKAKFIELYVNILVVQQQKREEKH